jgi:hypothetical protein
LNRFVGLHCRKIILDKTQQHLIHPFRGAAASLDVPRIRDGITINCTLARIARM